MIYTHDHEPEHVHVWKGDSEVVINLSSLNVRSRRDLNNQDTRRAQAIVAEAQKFLMSEWNRIDPLP